MADTRPEHTPYFNIEVVDDAVWVKLVGKWTVPIDLEYMTHLSQIMSNMRNKSWSIIVDMRHWQVTPPKVNEHSQEMANIHLDRRNQILEAWWVNDSTQAEFLVPYVSQDRSMQFVRSTAFSDIEKALKSKRVNTQIPESWK